VGEFNYNDGMCSGGRRPRLYFAKGRQAFKFEGTNIPEFAAISRTNHQKNGKWSNTDYVFTLAPGVRGLYFLSPLHGTWGDEFTSWGELAHKLALSVDVAQAIVRIEYAKTADRLDRLESFSAAMELSASDMEVVVISFGSPHDESANAGYWNQQKETQTTDGSVVLVRPFIGDRGPDWSKAEVVEPEGAKVVSAQHTAGMRGGYWAIEVAVPVI
jgi:hypothetical protein